jgi:protoporphyrinogen oxidase
MADEMLILGGGMTGLAAGMVSGAPVLEAAEGPGGICRSYYVRPGSDAALYAAPEDGDAYRFENGGGHWIFGGDAPVLDLLGRSVRMRRYARRSSVYFPSSDQFVPYPLQNHLRHLDRQVALTALEEMARPSGAYRTMAEWLEASFGPTLTRLFFDPFHDLYTAGLHRSIAPQDPYKSPVDLRLALRGALQEAPAVGYNTTFLYPEAGLDTLARRLADRCAGGVHFGSRIVAIDLDARCVLLADGERLGYSRLLSTLPLNQAVAMAGLATEAAPDPYTSVLVLNVGAIRGHRCPDDHWLYVPRSQAGFHRVGFYSNVDRSFLPQQSGDAADRVSIYIERAFVGGQPAPGPAEIAAYADAVVTELQQWGFITDVEASKADWIDVAYTWSWPGSTWRSEAIRLLESRGVFPVGRYARWVFQGIADSIRDGFAAGASLGAPSRPGADTTGTRR